VESPQDRDIREIRAMVSPVPDRERRALLIARNVESRSGQGTRTDRGRLLPDAAEVPGVKLSAAAFARAVDSDLLRRTTVAETLTIWNWAADQLGILPHADELSPGDEIDWPGGWTWRDIVAAHQEVVPVRKRSGATGRAPSLGTRSMMHAVNGALEAAMKLPTHIAMTSREREIAYSVYVRLTDVLDAAFERVVDADEG
jgi:hypothetical protein